MKNYFENEETIRTAFEEGIITWADILAVTCMTPEMVYDLLAEIINKPIERTKWELGE